MVIDFANDAQVMLAQMTVTGIAQEKETILQKAENEYMAENNKRMPEADAPLFFVIDEKSGTNFKRMQ